MISTKGRYALRVLVDLAQHMDGDFTPMKEVAKRQGISLKYLEQILPLLRKKGIVETSAGKGGGYRLVSSSISVLDVLRVTENEMATVACLTNGGNGCSRASQCVTLPMWQKFDVLVQSFFGSITIKNLIDGKLGYLELLKPTADT